jgi:hypothetical protein
MLMALGPEVRAGRPCGCNSDWRRDLSPAPQDVSKVRTGKLSPFTIQLLRDLNTFLGITFKLKPDPTTKTTL